jgi:uncharacterized protein YlxP (DUF503 family)
MRAARETMVVGVLYLALSLPASESLKDKRQVVKSLLARVRNQFNVAAAEVDSLDDRQMATLGFSCVSNEGRHAEQVLSKVLAYIERTRLEAEVTDYSVELITVD